MKDTYSIGELVKTLGISKETVRYYEKIGLLSRPAKNENGYRVYSQDDIEKIKSILIIKYFGFSLREIGLLLNDEILRGNIQSIKKVVQDKLKEINEKMNELKKTKRMLEKVNKNIIEKNITCCGNIEEYYKNKS